MYISEVSKALHISKKAMELYESKGLISPSKNETGYRIYTSKEIASLKKIQLLRNIGFTIVEIKGILIDQNDDIFQKKKKSLIKETNKLQTIIDFYADIEHRIFHEEDADTMEDNFFETLKRDEDVDIKSNFIKLEIIDFNKIFKMMINYAFLCLLVFILIGSTTITYKEVLIILLLLLGAALSIEESTSVQLWIIGLYLQIKERFKI